MKNIVQQLERGCFSTMSWAVGGLRYGEKLISIEVRRKLREDEFFQWLLTGMKDWRRAYSLSNCSGQVMFFLRSGITMASLKTEGKTPVRRDLLIMAVTAGSSWSKHSTKRDVGIGSSEQVFWEDFKIMFLTHCIDSGWKEQNEDCVQIICWQVQCRHLIV